MRALTNQSPVTASAAVTPPPYNPEVGPTETQPALALYTDGDIHMGNVDDVEVKKRSYYYIRS